MLKEPNTLDGELTSLLNSYSAENDANTPDYILAVYLLNCLDAFNNAVQSRDKWYAESRGYAWRNSSE